MEKERAGPVTLLLLCAYGNLETLTHKATDLDSRMLYGVHRMLTEKSGEMLTMVRLDEDAPADGE